MTQSYRTTLLLLSGLLLVGPGCGGEPHGRKVNLASGRRQEISPADVPRRAPVRVAVAPVISPRESAGLYRPLMDFVSDQLDRPVVMLLRSTYAEVNDLIRYGHADVAFVCDYAFVEGERDFGMEVLVVPVVLGKRTYQSYIIVPAESEAGSLTDLRGKSFAFSDPLSSSGWLFPTYLLHAIGERPQTFFRRHVFTYSHDNTVRAVAQRLVDGGAVDSLVYEYMLRKDPRYKRQTKVIQQSDPWGNPPVVVHPKIDSVLRGRLQQVFLTMHQTKAGQEVLDPLDIDRFVLPDTHAYDAVRAMAEEVRRRLGSRPNQESANDRSEAKPGTKDSPVRESP